MGINAFELFATLGLDTTQFQSGLNSAQTAGASFGSAISKLGPIIVSAFAVKEVAEFGKTAVVAGEDFDKAMSQVASTMGTTVGEIQNLRDYAQEMGSTTAFSATQSAEALNYMALAGYDASTSMEMLPNVLNLASAGGMELATASDMVTDAQSALGLTLEQTTQMVDIMAKTSSTTNTSVQQLGEAFLTVGGLAKNLSGGTEELAQALGILADNGIKGSEGGTKLRNIILKLSAPTKDGAEALKELGVEAFDDTGKMRQLSDIMLDLKASMDGLGDDEKTQYITDIFNVADVASVNALLDTTADRWDTVAEKISEAEGSAEKMAETQLDNLAGDITLFQSALEGLQIALSDGVTPVLREFVQFGSEGLSELTEAFQSEGITGAVDVLGDKLSEFLSKIVDLLPEAIDAGGQLIFSLVNGILDNIPKILETALEIVENLGEGLVEAIPELMPKITSVMLGITEFLLDNLDRILDVAEEIILALADGLLNSLPVFIQKAPEIVLKIISALVDAIPDIIEFAVEFVDKVVNYLINYDWWSVGASINEAINNGFMNFGWDEKSAEEKQKKKIDDYSNFTVSQLDNAKTQMTNKLGEYNGILQNLLDPTYELDYSAIPENIRRAIENSGIDTTSITALQDWFGTQVRGMQSELETMGKATGNVVNDALESTSGNWWDGQASYTPAVEYWTAVAEAEAEGEQTAENQLTQSVEEYDNALKVEMTALENQYKRREITEAEYNAKALVLLNNRENSESDAWADYYDKVADYYEKLDKTQQTEAEKQIKKEQQEYEKQAKANKDAVDNYVKEIKTNLSSVATEYEKNAENLQKTMDSYADKLSGSYKSMYNFKTDKNGKVQSVKATDNMHETYKELNAYYEDIQDLLDRNVSSDMLNQLTSMDTNEATALAKYWNSLTDEQLKNLENNWEQVNNISDKISELLYKDESDELKTGLYTGLNSVLGEDKQWEEIGKSIVDGIVTGVGSKESYDKISDIVGDVVDTSINGKSITVSKAGTNYNYAYEAENLETVSATDTAVTAEKTKSESNNITVNVNGIQFQNFDELVTAISEQLAGMLSRKNAGFAT